MKRVIEVVIIVLLVSLVACGKKNNHGGSITKAPPSSPSEDVGQFAYRPPSSGAPGVKTPVLMSDYIYLENVKGDSNNKKLYAQMSLFWLKTPAADKTKTDQFQLYYREFVACQDGPRPANRGGVTNINSHLEVISGDANRAPKTKSILTLGDFGQFTKNAGKKIPLSGNLQIGHPINGYNFSLKPVVLNFKISNETLDTYKNLPKPDADPNKAILALKCTDAGQDESSPTVPYGPNISPTAPGHPGGKSFDDAKLIQDDELSADPASENQPS